MVVVVVSGFEDEEGEDEGGCGWREDEEEEGGELLLRCESEAGASGAFCWVLSRSSDPDESRDESSPEDRDAVGSEREFCGVSAPVGRLRSMRWRLAVL